MTSTLNLFTLALVPLILFVFWTLSATGPSAPFTSGFPTLYNKRICLLIAHPDDEAMFFAPTLAALTKPELGNYVKVLCLSSGDADGLGHIRKKELEKSALQLGLRYESDVFVVDDPSRFPDSMTANWSAAIISSLLAKAFAPDLTPQRKSPRINRTKSSTAQTSSSTTIDVLLTFDQVGVSNHPNHRSLYHGARMFLQNLMNDKPGYACPVTLYTLTSTNIFRKYFGIFDAPVTMLAGLVGNLSGGPSKNNDVVNSVGETRDIRGTREPPLPNRLLFVSGIKDWLLGWKAMVYSHKSQMVWFRWGWITIGRYMVVNDLKKEQL